MATFITSDWHLGEDRFEIMARPFKSVDEMVDRIIHNFNSIVRPDDDVIVVGDVCYQKSVGSLPIVSQFNGRRKTLVRGNHDRPISDAEFGKYFDTIIPEGEGIEIDAGGVPCYIVHYPSLARPDRFNLVGHIHAAWKYQLNSFNIGVDVNHFRPVNLDSIPFHLKAISEYYDQDVWVAYHAANANFVGKRGKSGTYFGGQK